MKTQFTQNLVSKTVWPWTEKTEKVKAPPPLSRVLTFLIIGLAVSGIFFYYGHTAMAAVVCMLAVFVFICSRFLPGVYYYVEKITAKLSQGIGIMISWLLLVPVYYTFFIFGRVLQKISGKDPMARSLAEDVESYWLSKETDDDLTRYKRQF